MRNILIIIMTILLSLSCVNALANSSALTAHYKLDDLTDYSSNHVDLINNGATTSSSCYDGDCYSFDGTNDYMNVTSNVFTFDGTNTISFWFKHESANPASTIRLINDYNNAGNDAGQNYIIMISTGAIGVRVAGGTTTTSATDFADNTWKHLVLTSDGSNYELFIENVSIGTGTVGAQGIHNAINIGQRVDNAQWWKGEIDDLTVFNYKLSAADVSDLYGNGITYPSSTPQIQTNLSNTYNINTISGSATTTTNTNMTFFQNGVQIGQVNNTDNTSFTLANLSVGDNNISLRSENILGISWNNFTLTYQPIQYFNFYNINNGSLLTNYTFNGISENNGYVKINASNLNYGSNTAQFVKTGFYSQNFTFNLTKTSQLNLSFNVSVSTIVISLFDRETEALLTGATNIILISSVGFNSTTTTGYLNISSFNFIAESYQIIAARSNYETETIYFDFTNQELLELNIYMVPDNSSNLGNIIVKAITDVGGLIENAVCKALEWKPTQSAYISVAEGLTNINGETILNIELNVKNYKFSCTKDGITGISSPQIIQNTDTTLPVLISSGEAALISNYDEFSYTFTNSSENSTHDRFIYTFEDEQNIITHACLKWYQVNGIRKTLINESCVETSIGEIQQVIKINNTYTLVVDAVGSVSGSLTTVDSKSYKGIADLSFALNRYNLDLILPLLFAIVGMALGYGIRPNNVFLGMVGAIIGVWMAILIVPTVLSVEIASFITVILLLMLWGGQNKK